MNLPEQRSDEDLAANLAQGDATASATLAQRYAPGIYDFAIRITLDPAAAASATESALNRVSTEIGSRPGDLSFRAWLFGIARDESLEALRQRSRGDAGADELTATAISPVDARFLQAAGLTPPDAAAWSWSAARGQRPRDYSILDLLLRRKITPEEVAEIASLSRNGVYAVVGRLRGAFEESFVAAALFASGRKACPDLDVLLGDAISLGPAMRREISRHADTCPVCKQTRALLPAAADVFAALDDVEIPDDVTDRLLPFMLAAGPAVPPAPPLVSEPEDEEEEEPGGDGIELPGAIGAAAAGGLGASAGFASNGEDAEAASTAELDAEADSDIVEAADEEPPTAQASLFEAEADSTESEVDLAEQLVAEDEPEAAKEQDVDDEPLTAAEPAASIEAEPELPDDVTHGLPRPAYVAGASSTESILDVEDEDVATYVQDTSAEEAYDDDEAYDEDNRPEPELLAEFDEADAALEAETEVDEETEPRSGQVAIFGRPDVAPAAAGAGGEEVEAGALVAAGVAGEGLQRRRQRLQGAGGGRPPARRGPFDGEQDSGRSRRKYFLYAMFGGAVLVAAYLGIAFGDSIQGGGGGDSEASALPTRAAGLTDVACPGPVQINQGSRVALTFTNIPSGYTLAANPAIAPKTATSAVSQVSATSQQGNTILFAAATVQNSAGRTDEYELTATFAKGSEKSTQSCVIRVMGPAGTPAAPTVTRTPAGSPSPAVTNTVPPATATTAPIIQPTAIPTDTPIPPTATPDNSTPTPVPTAGGVLISPTETFTPTPTVTRTPTP